MKIYATAPKPSEPEKTDCHIDSCSMPLPLDSFIYVWETLTPACKIQCRKLVDTALPKKLPI